MSLRVFIVCTECHRQRELLVDGTRVSVEIEHDCDADSAFTVTEELGERDRQLTMAA